MSLFFVLWKVAIHNLLTMPFDRPTKVDLDDGHHNDGCHKWDKQNMETWHLIFIVVHPFTVRMKSGVSKGRDKKILSGKKCVCCRRRKWRSA
jgi:hypothetical protein